MALDDIPMHDISMDGAAWFEWEKFGDAVSNHLKSSGVTMRKQAERLAIDKSTMHRAADGKPVRVEIVLALCRWMHADPFWYFQGAIK